MKKPARRIPIQFNVKQLFVISTLITLLMAILMWFYRSGQPDPESEALTVQKRLADPDWQVCPKKLLTSALVAHQRPIISPGYKGVADLKFNQELCTYRLLDYFGFETLEVKVEVQGDASANWTEYRLVPIIGGGGNSGASAEVYVQFGRHEGLSITDSSPPALKILTVTIHNQFDRFAEARILKLKFVWNGKKFDHIPGS